MGQHSTGRLNGGRFPRTPFACPQPKRATACTHSINVLIDARAALVRIADELEVPVPKRLDAWLQRAPCQARFVVRKCRSVARAMRCWRSVQEGRAGLTIRGRRTCYKGTLLARVSLRADPLQRASRGGRRVTKELRLPLLRKHGRLRQKEDLVTASHRRHFFTTPYPSGVLIFPEEPMPDRWPIDLLSTHPYVDCLTLLLLNQRTSSHPSFEREKALYPLSFHGCRRSGRL